MWGVRVGTGASPVRVGTAALGCPSRAQLGSCVWPHNCGFAIVASSSAIALPLAVRQNKTGLKRGPFPKLSRCRSANNDQRTTNGGSYARAAIAGSGVALETLFV